MKRLLIAGLCVLLAGCTVGLPMYEAGTKDPHVRDAYEACQADLRDRYEIFVTDSIHAMNPWLYDCMKSKGYGYRPK